jgi:hypothetical protein
MMFFGMSGSIEVLSFFFCSEVALFYACLLTDPDVMKNIALQAVPSLGGWLVTHAALLFFLRGIPGPRRFFLVLTCGMDW